jgi:hypothetical protein
MRNRNHKMIKLKWILVLDDRKIYDSSSGQRYLVQRTDRRSKQTHHRRDISTSQLLRNSVEQFFLSLSWSLRVWTDCHCGLDFECPSLAPVVGFFRSTHPTLTPLFSDDMGENLMPTTTSTTSTSLTTRGS